MSRWQVLSLGIIALVSCIFAAVVDTTNLTGDGTSGNDYIVLDSQNEAVGSGVGISTVGYFRSLSDGEVAATQISAVQELVSDFEVVAQDSFEAAGIAGIYFGVADYVQTESNLGKSWYGFIGNRSTLETSTEFLLIRYNAEINVDSPALPESDSLILSPDSGSLIFGSVGPAVNYDATAINGNANQAAKSLVLEDSVGDPPAGPVTVTSISKTAGGFFMAVEGLVATRSYILVRSADLQSFHVRIGSPFTGGTTHTFQDPNPPASRAFYRVELSAP